jgi:hypothetical protein
MFEPFSAVKIQRYFTHSQYKWITIIFSKDQSTTYNFKHFYFPPAGRSFDAIQTYGKQSERYYQHATEIEKEKWK